MKNFESLQRVSKLLFLFLKIVPTVINRTIPKVYEGVVVEFGMR